MRNHFDEQLEQLNQHLIEMGTLCEEAISQVTDALIQGDCSKASGVAEKEMEIDHKEREIESQCLKLLLQQQPVARDLRQISAALKMITDMERIGDQALDIAEIISYIGDQIPMEQISGIGDMGRATVKMVIDSINAFVNNDLELAKAVIEYDNVVDNLFTQVKKELIALISINPANGEQALDSLMIAKYFERIGDHATNIAEWVEFSITGQHVIKE